MAKLPKDAVILAGDIGGTKANLALFQPDPSGSTDWNIVRHARYPSTEFAGLNAIIRKFLSVGAPGKIVAAGFGAPGPVKDGSVRPSNLSWAIDSKLIREEFDIPQVVLVNDLAANAYGISELKPSDFEIIQPGAEDASGNRCIVSPGTGLGQAGLFWDGSRHHVWACEGGHTDFGPRTELEIALLQHLIKQYGHVSYERVVSGMGLENIYKFLRDTGRGEELSKVAQAMKTEEAGAVISRYAESGECPVCMQTLDLFVSCLAAEVGNMALKSMATGGVFLGGGIPVKLLSRLKSVAFLHAFADKGRMRSLMESMPIKVILNDQAALLGAARQALNTL